MIRRYVPLALIGLALVPDWATALGGRRRCAPPPPPPCPPRLVFVSPCLPTIPVAPPNYSILPAPTVQVEPTAATPAPTKPEQPKTDPAPAAPRPVAPGVPPGTAAADPGGAVKPADFAKPQPAAPAEPKPAPKLTLDPPAPKADPPKTEAPKAEAPKVEAPKLQVPQVPTPGAAADPGKGEGEKIPPLIPQLPSRDVPRLAIPQVPVEPADRGGTSTSKASPLTGSPRVDIFPVNGPPPGDPKARRTVGFFNHTDRDLKLTVEGDTVTLPRRHYVTAAVPQTFTWKLGDDERRTEVPAAAPGVEVVIRQSK